MAGSISCSWVIRWRLQVCRVGEHMIGQPRIRVDYAQGNREPVTPVKVR
ncbi:hypothetical protein ACFQUU_10040 [Herbaspirillum sp. GCM10030257]